MQACASFSACNELRLVVFVVLCGTTGAIPSACGAAVGLAVVALVTDRGTRLNVPTDVE